MTEIELSILEKQCLNRRIPDRPTFKTEVKVWEKKRNAVVLPMNWWFIIEDTRIKLKKLHPPINS